MEACKHARKGHRVMLLGEMVVARGIATVEEVLSALQRQSVQGGHLGAHLIALGVMTPLELSTLLVEQNDARTTLPFCERTLIRWESEFGVHHAATARARCNLAHALLSAGQAKEALAASQMAFTALRATYGDDHAWTKDAAAAVKAAHHAVYGPEAAALARLRALTKQAEPVKV
jgi:Tetratricopeptide repeat